MIKLPAAAMRVLHAVAEAGCRTSVDVAEHLGVTPHYAGYYLRRLERFGRVRRAGFAPSEHRISKPRVWFEPVTEVKP